MSDEHSAQIISHLFLTAGYTEKKTGNKQKNLQSETAAHCKQRLQWVRQKCSSPQGFSSLVAELEWSTEELSLCVMVCCTSLSARDNTVGVWKETRVWKDFPQTLQGLSFTKVYLHYLESQNQITKSVTKMFQFCFIQTHKHKHTQLFRGVLTNMSKHTGTDKRRHRHWHKHNLFRKTKTDKHTHTYIEHDPNV